MIKVKLLKHEVKIILEALDAYRRQIDETEVETNEFYGICNKLTGGK